MYTSINEFKQHLNIINENVQSSQIVEVYSKILNKLDDLKDLDILNELVESGVLFGLYPGPNTEYSKAYTVFHRELVPAWINKLWMDKLKSGGQSMNDIYKYAEVFQKWIENKGYESQEVFLAYFPGYGDDTEGTFAESLGNVDFNNVDASVDSIVSKIKSHDVWDNYRGYFKMGFDVMQNENEENPGFAVFAFHDFSSNNIVEDTTIDVGDLTVNNSNGTCDVIFKPNTALFYKYVPGAPYKDMVDACTDAGYVLRLD